VRRVSFESDPVLPRPEEELSTARPPAHLREALDALAEYLARPIASAMGAPPPAFVVPLDLHGITSFQRRVYQRLLEIPYGQVVTYGRVAEDIGAEGVGAARAVGQAVGANPIPILIPCHRVVGADGKLTGFGGGTGRKAALLAIEGIDVDGDLPTSRVRPEVLRLPL
jgi:methylated-DNA-[protein]-cysteine S-methyltransferase